MAYDVNDFAKVSHLKLLAEKVRDNYATKSELNTLSGKVDGLITTGGQPNVLEGVKVNGVALSIAEKMVDILIATGSANGTVSVNGADVAVKGLAALAFKANVSEADLDAALKAVIDAKAAQSDLNALTGLVNTLIGEDSGKSARTIANEELAKQLIPENAKESLNELQEIAAWIQSHPDDASAMNQAITDLTALVGTLPEGATSTTVVGYIAEAIAALSIGDYAKTSEVESKISAAIEALGMADYAKTTEVEADITEAINGLNIGQYAKTTEVEADITEAINGLGIGDYAKTADVAQNYYSKTQIDSMMATDAEVTDMLNEVFGA